MICLPMGAMAEEMTISLSQTSLELTVGDTATLSYTLSADTEMEYSVSWSSGNSGVVSVSESGDVTANGIGTSTVSATLTYYVEETVMDENGEETVVQKTKHDTASCTVKVSAKRPTEPSERPTPPPSSSASRPSTSIKVLPTVSSRIYITLKVGKTDQLKPGLSGYITYKVGDPTIVSVSSTGLVTGAKEGTTWIQAYNSQYSQQYQITVTAADVKETTTTVKETDTTAKQAGTVSINNSSGSTTNGNYVYQGTSDDDAGNSQDNNNTKLRIVIASIGIIAVIIVLILTIYGFKKSKKEEALEGAEDTGVDDEVDDVNDDSDDDDDGNHTEFYL